MCIVKLDMDIFGFKRAYIAGSGQTLETCAQFFGVEGLTFSKGNVPPIVTVAESPLPRKAQPAKSVWIGGANPKNGFGCSTGGIKLLVNVNARRKGVGSGGR